MLDFNLVACGLGKNSSAMLLGLYEKGEKPDAILFADTGGEHPYTYEFLGVLRDWCKTVGFPDILTVKYHSNLDDSLEEECLRLEVLPAKAYGFSSCSLKWKKEPQDRWARNSPKVKEVWSQGGKVIKLLGVHAGELRRVRASNDDRYVNRYPLVEWGWGEQECVEAFTRHGLPVPGKSSCWFCPSKKKKEVLELATQYPDLLARAIEMEEMSEHKRTTVKGLGRHWSWADLTSGAVLAEQVADEQAPLCEACFDGE